MLLFLLSMPLGPVRWGLPFLPPLKFCDSFFFFHLFSNFFFVLYIYLYMSSYSYVFQWYRCMDAADFFMKFIFQFSSFSFCFIFLLFSRVVRDFCDVIRERTSFSLLYFRACGFFFHSLYAFSVFFSLTFLSINWFVCIQKCPPIEIYQPRYVWN